MSHGTYEYACHIWRSHMSRILICSWDMWHTYSYVTRVFVTYDSFICDIWMSHMKESYVTNTHVTYEYVCHIWRRHTNTHVTYEWVMTHVTDGRQTRSATHEYESRHTRMSHVTYAWVMAHVIWNELCEWVMWMSYVNELRESVKLCEWVMWMSHDTHDRRATDTQHSGWIQALVFRWLQFQMTSVSEDDGRIWSLL